MPVAATAEFWEGLKPITTMLWANALPEIDPPDVANADECYFAPFTQAVSSRPLWISPRASFRDLPSGA